MDDCMSDASEEEAPHQRVNRRQRILIELSNCKHPIVKEAAESLGMRQAYGMDDFHLFWTDLSVSPERVMRMNQAHKAINHFPSMDMIARKIPLAININRMRKNFPDDFDFIPKSYTDYREYLADCAAKSSEAKRKKKKTFYIVKPNSGCMGKGIFMTGAPTQKMFENAVVQEYLSNPMLIEGRKFDLRCYVLLLSVTPLRILFFRDGLVRICAEDYTPPTDENITIACKHITNYAVNKKSDKFVFNQNAEEGDTGSKRDFRFLNRWFQQQGYDPAHIWDGVHSTVIKTFIAVSRTLAQSYRSAIMNGDDLGMACFELLGFDIMLDASGKSWLIEVNHSPSLVVDTPLDRRIKLGLLQETLTLCNIPHRNRNVKKTRKGFYAHREKFEDANMELFTRIYPASDGSHKKFDVFLKPATGSSVVADLPYGSATMPSRSSSMSRISRASSFASTVTAERERSGRPQDRAPSAKPRRVASEPPKANLAAAPAGDRPPVGKLFEPSRGSPNPVNEIPREVLDAALPMSSRSSDRSGRSRTSGSHSPPRGFCDGPGDGARPPIIKGTSSAPFRRTTVHSAPPQAECKDPSPYLSSVGKARKPKVDSHLQKVRKIIAATDLDPGLKQSMLNHLVEGTFNLQPGGPGGSQSVPARNPRQGNALEHSHWSRGLPGHCPAVK
mmetsp:Transcript_74470/g.131617  ORF Transcript_74470/g.131617 Transcript_74470/m.131617 type:complete len:672 (-) Transcript_74470:497-2512(-)